MDEIANTGLRKRFLKPIALISWEDKTVREFERMNISLIAISREMRYMNTLLERTFIPPDGIEFDKIFTSTSAIGASSSITIGTFAFPANTYGMIKKIGLSLPIPATAGNIAFLLLRNKIPYRDWAWTHDASLNVDIGMGKSGIDNPIEISIPTQGEDRWEFQVSATTAESSKSYAIRFIGWYRKKKDREV